MATFLIGMWPSPYNNVQAAQISPRSLKLSDALPGAGNVTYNITMGVVTVSVVGSIRIQFCSNSALIGDPCTAPFGFDATSAVLSQQTGTSGFLISTDSTANELILTRPPAVQAATFVTLTFDNMSNPAAGGSYYGRFLTYASSDASGPSTDAGGVAFAIQGAIGVSAEVPPYLTFCVGEIITGTDCTTATEPFTDLGELSSVVTSVAESQLVVATNASNGYSMWAAGTSMTSGNNVITAMSGGTSQVNTSQFGINLRANTLPPGGADPSGPGTNGVITAGYNQPDHYRFVSGDVLADSFVPDNPLKYTVTYVVNIPSAQPGGVYSTTLTYICLGNF
ncbi:MAG TPA: hypothetical protein VLH84_01845 [Patescibacteria group bacterium]|nr:hypothetical protein [Patescibacteria group bacterium]